MQLINDTNYAQQISELVLPALASTQKELWLERQPGKKIHCLSYQAQQARGIIVISHGFTETAEKYMEMIYYFLENHYHVYAMDHCGHGYSYRLVEDPCKVHIDRYMRYVKDLAYVSEQAKQAFPDLPMYLFAHSMGGAIGTLTAAHYPQLFQKIILNAPMIQPVLHGLSWNMATFLSFLSCLTGKSSQYLPGHGPYRELEEFETSCASYKPRFDVYNQIKYSTREYQTSGATYSWLYQSTCMYRAIMGKACRTIKQPLLLFQADGDTMVSLPKQQEFIDKLKSCGNQNAQLVTISPSKHEIYLSDNAVMEFYLKRLFEFLES